MAETDDRVRILEERIERLEKQIAVLLKRTSPPAARQPARDYRDRYDSLDYPER